MPFCISGNWQKFKWYTEYTKRDEWEIHYYTGPVAAKAIGHGDVSLRFSLLEAYWYTVVACSVLYFEGTYNSLSQSRHMDQLVLIVPVNGYRSKIYNKSPTDSAQTQTQEGGWGQGNHVDIASQIGGLFWPDVSFTGQIYWARGQ